SGRHARVGDGPGPRRLRRSVFFSSRRRHTRFSRDWSSDVCSSDLINDQIDSLELRLQRREETMRAQFIRMEQMLATLNAQATALAGQLAQISAIAAGGGSRGG